MGRAIYLPGRHVGLGLDLSRVGFRGVPGPSYLGVFWVGSRLLEIANSKLGQVDDSMGWVVDDSLLFKQGGR